MRVSPESSSSTGDRLQSACVRGCDAWMQVARLARKVCEELDDLTSPGFRLPEIDEESSLVTTIGAALQVVKTGSGG